MVMKLAVYALSGILKFDGCVCVCVPSESLWKRYIWNFWGKFGVKLEFATLLIDRVDSARCFFPVCCTALSTKLIVSYTHELFRRRVYARALRRNLTSFKRGVIMQLMPFVVFSPHPRYSSANLAALLRQVN